MTEALANPEIEEMMLTTIDNPFNPKTDYDKWRQWDLEKGHNTESYLARIMDLPPEIDIDDEVTISIICAQAMYDIVEHDMAKIYKIVY